MVSESDVSAAHHTHALTVIHCPDPSAGSNVKHPSKRPFFASRTNMEFPSECHVQETMLKICVTWISHNIAMKRGDKDVLTYPNDPVLSKAEQKLVLQLSFSYRKAFGSYLVIWENVRWESSESLSS